MNKKTQQLKNHQSYIKTLEAKLKDASKKMFDYKNKLKIAETKLAEATRFLYKAKAIIENNEITIETYRSMKLSVLDSIKSLFTDEKSSLLCLKYIELRDDFIPVINKIIKANPYIEILDLEGNLISDEGILLICDIITNCFGKLHTINLEYNFITAIGA